MVRVVPLALDRGGFLGRAAAEGDPGRGSPRLGPRARGDDHGGGVVPPSLVLLAEIGRRGAFRRGRSGRPRRDRRGASRDRAAGRVRGPRGVPTPRGFRRGGARGDVVHVRRDHRRILVLNLGGFPVVEDRDLRHDSGSDPPGGPIPVVPGDRGRRVRPRRAGEGILWPVLGGGGHAVAANLATRGPRPRHGTSAHWSVRG